MTSLLYVLLGAGLAFSASGCTSASRTLADAGASAAPFSFVYEVALGRDCYMIGDCGYRLVLTPDGLLTRFAASGEATASAQLSAAERASFLGQLEAGGFFALPDRLPDASDSEIMRGGRRILMRFESQDGGSTKQIEAYTDAQSIQIPERFFALDEAVRAYLMEALSRE